MSANNVFAHADDLIAFAHAIRRLLKPNGIFVFEASHLLSLVRDGLFDMIYHEHLSYHSVGPLKTFFERHDLKLFDVEKVNTHGGSIRGFVQKRDGSHRIRKCVDQVIAEEKTFGLDQPGRFRKSIKKFETVGSQLRLRLQDLKSQGQRIAGFGAPAKATTLMFQFGLFEFVDFILEDSPWKQGLYSPGLHIPILPVTILHERQPNCILVLAWNFADSILQRLESFIAEGGRVIVPLPELREVSRE